MEPAGLALGAIVLIKPMCKTIHDTWQGFRLYGSESEKLNLRFSVQASRIDSFEKILFEPGKLNPIVPGRVIDSLPNHVCQGLAGLLCELYSLMQEYVSRDSRYAQNQRPPNELATALKDVGGTTTSQQDVAVLLALSSKGAADKQKAADWMSKITWALRDKRAMEKLVVEFEHYTERLGSLVELAFWPLPLARSLSAITPLESDSDAANTGLSRGISIRKLVLEPSLSQPGKCQALLEMPRTSFRECGDSGVIQFGQLKGTSDSWHMVEYRTYGDGSAADTQDKIIQLAALLHRGPDADPQLKLCQCVGYFHDSTNARIGLVSRLPLSTAATPGSIPSLASLLSIKSLRPRLQSRVRLALALVQTVHRLHLYGWLHKSLRSDNIIFPLGHDSSGGSADSSSVLEDPRVRGFEYSRRESDFSSVQRQDDHIQNLYRHPARWGLPTERFNRIHDLYGKLIRIFPHDDPIAITSAKSKTEVPHLSHH